MVWGAAYLSEAAARVVIIELVPAGTALAVSKTMPYVVAALLIGWTTVYGKRSRHRGEQLAAAQLQPPPPASPAHGAARAWPHNPPPQRRHRGLAAERRRRRAVESRIPWSHQPN